MKLKNEYLIYTGSPNGTMCKGEEQAYLEYQKSCSLHLHTHFKNSLKTKSFLSVGDIELIQKQSTDKTFLLFHPHGIVKYKKASGFNASYVTSFFTENETSMETRRNFAKENNILDDELEFDLYKNYSFNSATIKQIRKFNELF